jgi:hypothetical protein
LIVSPVEISEDFELVKVGIELRRIDIDCCRALVFQCHDVPSTYSYSLSALAWSWTFKADFYFCLGLFYPCHYSLDDSAATVSPKRESYSRYTLSGLPDSAEEEMTGGGHFMSACFAGSKPDGVDDDWLKP